MSKNLNTPNINFVGGDELLEKPGGRFLRWALSVGKVIVVLTELIVVLAFISRFKLDSDIADYNELIKRKKSIIEASSQFEDKFRSFSYRVSLASEVMNLYSADKTLGQIINSVPEGVVVTDLAISEDTVHLAGNAQNEGSLAVLSANFKGSKIFTNVSLERVSKTGSDSFQDIAFSLAANYVKGGNNATR